MKHSLESTIIRLMLLVRRVGAKMGGSLWLLQRILSSLLPADDIDVADEPVHLSDGITDADLAPLLAMLPGKKRYGSCLRDNDLSHKDDYEQCRAVYRLFLALPFRQPSCLRHLLPSATSVLRRLHDVRPALATFGTRTPHQRLPCLHACGDDKTLTMTKLW